MGTFDDLSVEDVMAFSTAGTAGGMLSYRRRRRDISAAEVAKASGVWTEEEVLELEERSSPDPASVFRYLRAMDDVERQRAPKDVGELNREMVSGDEGMACPDDLSPVVLVAEDRTKCPRCGRMWSCPGASQSGWLMFEPAPERPYNRCGE